MPKRVVTAVTIEEGPIRPRGAGDLGEEPGVVGGVSQWKVVLDVVAVSASVALLHVARCCEVCDDPVGGGFRDSGA